MDYFKGNQEIQLQISELFISEQMFCRTMTFQNGYHWLLLKDKFKPCIKFNTLLNRSAQLQRFNIFKALNVLRVFLFLEYQHGLIIFVAYFE